VPTAWWLQLLALTGSLSGTVVDPQGLPLRGARVELACESQRTSIETDSRGRFAIAMSTAPGGCRLLVAFPGFSVRDEPVVAARDMGRLALQLEQVTQQVHVVAEPGPSRSMGSVVLAGADLRAFAGTTAALVEYLRVLAGGTTQPGVVYVDGLPATWLPPLDAIAAITINADPFSVERADGDVASIDIVTRAPVRKFALSVGSDVLDMGGGDPLAAGSRSATMSRHVGIGGAVPRVPLTFVANLGLGSVARDVPIRAVIPGGNAVQSTAESRTRTSYGSVSLHWAPASPLKARFSYRESRGNSVNLGVGGIVLPEAGSSAASRTREARAMVTAAAHRFLYEGSVLISTRQWSTRANTGGAGVAVSGDVVMGGAPITAGGTSRASWMSTHVARGRSGAPWSVGLTVSRTTDSDEQTPNPSGSFEFADLAAYEQGLAGGATATWFVTRGDGAVRYSSLRIAPFVQRQFLATNHAEVVGGARADYQSGHGAVVSPRLSVAVDWRGWNLRGGGGLFVRPLPNTIFIAALKNDGAHLQQYMTPCAALDGEGGPSVRLETTIRSRTAPDLAPPRQAMARVSVERPVGRFVPGIEYTWSRDGHLLGAERRMDGEGWLDIIESRRAAERHRLHMQLLYTWKGQHVSAQYERIHARDDTNGPYSYAERPGSTTAEWARSAGVSPHHVTVTGAFTLPARMSLSVTHTWRSPAPYDVTTGRDASGNGLFLDRGGRARNSGDGPAYSSLDVYAYRRVRLPNVLRTGARKLHASIGLQAQNVLNRRNVTSLGSVAGTANFGRPLAAHPGRSLRLSISVN